MSFSGRPMQDIRTMREAGTRANEKLGHEPKAKVDLKCPGSR